MKNILVLGGAGYIGSHTVKNLLRKGYNPIVVDNLENGYRQAILSDIFYEADIGDKTAICSILKKYDIDVVLHFAAYISVSESVENPAKYYDNNLIKTINLLDCMVENNVKNIVFSSSCAIYGNPQYVPVDEQHPACPINPYGNSKLMIEKILEDYDKAYNVKSICLRYFNVAGADKDGLLCQKNGMSLISLLLQRASGGGHCEPFEIFGNDYNTPDGTCIRDYIHVEDLADAHVLAIDKLLSEEKSHKINLGTGNGFSVKEIINSVERVTGKNIPVCISPRRKGDCEEIYALNDYAKLVLGWSPKYTNIDDIIASAYNVMQNPPF